MWRRQQAFKRLGHEVFVVTWASLAAGEFPTAEDRGVIKDTSEKFTIIPIRSDLWSRFKRLGRLWRYPSYIASRIPGSAERRSLLAEISAFGPDIIWLEGVHAQWLAKHVSRQLGVRLIYRSHNVEHRYLAEQARLTRSPRRKLALLAGTFGLERCEKALHAFADHVYDISSDDLAYWQKHGYANNAWLPPQAETNTNAPLVSDEAHIDLLYVGGLSSPNNEAGLRWYFDKVHEKVLEAIPDISVTIAGRSPGKGLIEVIQSKGANLICDPVDISALYRASRTTMNPILHGSGVNIKTIDMLASSLPLITTSVGARGLPADVKVHMHIGDTPEDFSKLLISAVFEARRERSLQDRSEMIRRYFGDVYLKDALESIHEKIILHVF